MELVEEKEEASFDDWGGGRGEFNDGVADVCEGEEEVSFQCRLLKAGLRECNVRVYEASTTGPTPSLFQVSLYVDNNDIGQLAPVFVMEKTTSVARKEPVVVVIHFNDG
ncbi:hypothetical protein GmHk_15G043981 [Glycine max]|nr:hypothetical protein GmHk_15G043981 [Glycine max]